MKQLDKLSPVSSYVVLVVTYFALLFLLPASKVAMHNYHLSTTAYHVLLSVVELPLAVMWVAAFYGYTRLRQYANVIAKTPEGAGFLKLTRGFQWLALTLVIPPAISLIANGIANRYTGLHASALIISNYASMIFPLVAFTFMAGGAERLLAKGKWSRSVTYNLRTIYAVYAVLSATYCFMVFRHITSSSLANPDNAYYLPTWLLIGSIVIPYLYIWYTGLTAAYEINILAKNARGVLYRQGLALIARGVMLVIVSLVGSQLLQAIMPRTGHLALNVVLLLIYIVYIVITLGFVLIGLGANRLKRIEDI